MLDHLAIGVRDMAASRAFYEAALAPLGFAVVMERDDRIAFGPTQRPIFFLVDREPGAGIHIAFQASDRAAVSAALAACPSNVSDMPLTTSSKESVSPLASLVAMPYRERPLTLPL